MHGLILYFIFPQGQALITLPFDPTQEKRGRYCSEDQVRNSVEILVNISRLFQDAPKLYYEARRMEVWPPSASPMWFLIYCLFSSLSLANGLSKRSRLAPRPPKVNRRVLLWAGCEHESNVSPRTGNKWGMCPVNKWFPEDYRGTDPRRRSVSPKAWPDLSSDNSVTLGKLCQLPQSLLSHPQDEDKRSTPLWRSWWVWPSSW